MNYFKGEAGFFRITTRGFYGYGCVGFLVGQWTRERQKEQDHKGENIKPNISIATSEYASQVDIGNIFKKTISKSTQAKTS